ncbi:sulfite exporter TauE/SafE family protein [Parasediminibacterium sp. JCM 36343]|uniref:sulfite exporter TauE/SafE family protein n=1 Tax=Parasediminibacterium sp. JCM 36343 TaxID=3374279 RepID=UPI00397E598E
MQWPFLLTALALGAVSSFHCVGMCGAIALSLPVKQLTGFRKTIAVLLYNAGRIATYSSLGLLFGIAGRGLYIGGFQKWFSIAAGLLLLVFAIGSLFQSRLLRTPSFHKIFYHLQTFITKRMAKQSLPSILLIGVANGLLPCGMVYFAVMGAIATGNILGGIGFMAAFGLGTLPLMLAVSYFGFIIDLSFRNRIKTFIPYFMAAMALMLVARGLSYNHAHDTNADIIPCHKMLP